MSAQPPKSNLSAILYRQLLRGSLAVNANGFRVEAQAGDYLEAALLPFVSAADRERLGPVVSKSRLEQRFGLRLEPSQPLFRPQRPSQVSEGIRLSAMEPQAGAFQVCRFRLGEDPRETLSRALQGPGDVLALDPGVECPLPDGEAALGALLSAALRSSEARVAFPAMNVSEPVSLPMVGDASSPTARMPGGRSSWELAELFAGSDLRPVAAWPSRPGAALLSRSLAESCARGFTVALPRLVPDVSGAAVTVPRAFVWRDADEAGPLASLLDTRGGHVGGWPETAVAAREIASGPLPGRPPVVLYSTEVGPWGGVAVLLSLADELQRLGLHALVLHRSCSPHAYRPRTPPLMAGGGKVIEEDFRSLCGGPGAVLAASHWGSGDLCLSVAKRHPDVALTSFLQDREDQFETPSGRPVPRKVWGPYLRIGEGVAVSRWIIDSAATDLGVDPTGYRVINPGVDMATFRPGPARTNNPVRILAMWRPMTAVRRGSVLLRETYDYLHAAHGVGVSLELFGWNGPEGASKAPNYTRHHGHLSPGGVAALMREVDIVVEPSLYQGFGLPGVEALACGAALVTTDCLGPREYVRHGENGLIVPHAELPVAVDSLVRDAGLRQRLQEAAPGSVAHLAWPLVGARWALYLAELYAAHGDQHWTSEWNVVAERAAKALEGSR